MQVLNLSDGRPWPLGAHCDDAGVNFAVWAPDAEKVEDEVSAA